MYQVAKYLPAGDKGIVIEFGSTICREINRKIRNLAAAIDNARLEGIGELVPTYRSLMLYYDPGKWGYGQLVAELKKIEAQVADADLFQPKVYYLPVLYGGEYGSDLSFVGRYTDFSPDEVIKIHTAADYFIYMLGFTPGFPYLGGMDERISVPRLEIPRTVIPTGSVGIAGNQTGVYPLESPGGWRLIGRTPVKLFDPSRNSPFLLEAGNYLRFYQITFQEYQDIAEKVANNSYHVKTLNYH
ncbi:MAG: 5-oxoprolinase subunit PxpB [Peptococcaceae bacterium]